MTAASMSFVPIVVEILYEVPSTSPWHQVSRIKFPLAAPRIAHGLKNGLIQAVAISTLATFVCGGGLGELIRIGLKDKNAALLYGSSIAVGVLAIFANILFSRSDTSKGSLSSLREQRLKPAFMQAAMNRSSLKHLIARVSFRSSEA